MKNIALLFALLLPLAPCYWDSDTLDTELRGLPDAFDLVVGRWHRHGEAYFRERITRLGGKSDLTLAEYDDLAVAHERLGDDAAAIAVLQRKADALAKSPTGSTAIDCSPTSAPSMPTRAATTRRWQCCAKQWR